MYTYTAIVVISVVKLELPGSISTLWYRADEHSSVLHISVCHLKDADISYSEFWRSPKTFLFGQWGHGTVWTVLTAPTRNILTYLLPYLLTLPQTHSGCNACNAIKFFKDIQGCCETYWTLLVCDSLQTGYAFLLSQHTEGTYNRNCFMLNFAA